MEKVYTVKFTPYRKNLGEIMFRQTEDNKGYSSDGRYKFIIDPNLDEADFWIVQSKGLSASETCCVSPKNTIFVGTEPKSVLTYPKKYLSQFGLVSICQKTNLPNVIYDYPTLPWYIGFTEDKDGIVKSTLDYNTLANSSTLTKKKKLISVITSNKAFTQGHIDRISFVQKLKNHYGDDLDIYGRGFNSFDDKWDILAPYKYHIVIENCIQDYYWTEKLSDSYLAETFPFYSGCKNISKYLPLDALLNIDIYDVKKSIKTIDNAINQNLFEHRIPTIQQAKRLMLGQYNMFNHMAALCDRLNAHEEKRKTTLQPCKTMGNINNVVNFIFGRNYYKQKQKVKNLLSPNQKNLKK